MKRSSPLVQRGASTDIDSAMTPMIDVVFLLLVFFVWTASFQIVEQVLPSEMSSQVGTDPVDVEPEPEKDFDDIVVKVAWDGNTPSWSINDSQIPNIETVQEKLKAISAINGQTTVILHPQPVVPVEFVIQSYDAAKLSGFEKVSFAVNQTQ
jgi:biopolymer transport protein ExbD